MIIMQAINEQVGESQLLGMDMYEMIIATHEVKLHPVWSFESRRITGGLKKKWTPPFPMNLDLIGHR